MKEFSLPLLETTEGYLPVLDYCKIPVLVDTGATIPVFFIEPPILSKNLGAKLVQENKKISGFGGNAEGDIYSLPKLTIGEYYDGRGHIAMLPVIVIFSLFTQFI